MQPQEWGAKGMHKLKSAWVRANIATLSDFHHGRQHQVDICQWNTLQANFIWSASQRLRASSALFFKHLHMSLGNLSFMNYKRFISLGHRWLLGINSSGICSSLLEPRLRNGLWNENCWTALPGTPTYTLFGVNGNLATLLWSSVVLLFTPSHHLGFSRFFVFRVLSFAFPT